MPFKRIQSINLMGGAVFEFSPFSSLHLGCVIPLNNDDDKQFDGEVRAMFDRRF